MLDRGKVISAYECVITRGKSVCECGKCDYHIKDSAVFFCDNQRVLTDALAMLKERDEVVRCKDCIYKEEHPSPYWKYWCNRLKCGCDDDWFCADGGKAVSE